MKEISWDDFTKVEMRVGTVIEVHDFPEARNPAYKLLIDFGELGKLKSSAQITALYSKDDLIGKQIIAVVNFPKKQIGPFMSECLVMGVYGEEKDIILIQPGSKCNNGWKVG